MKTLKIKSLLLALAAGSMLSSFAAGEVFVMRHKKYGASRPDMPNTDYVNLALSEYNTATRLYNDMSFMAKGAEGYNATYLAMSQDRVDGWFYVPADKAGSWFINQAFDDYMSIAIDGTWVLHNPTFRNGTSVTTTVAEGWHWLTVIYGDTYGGYGSNMPNYPFTIAVNGGGTMEFNSVNFQTADPTAATDGTFTIPLQGQTEFATMTMAATCRLLFDPATQHPHLYQCPSFAKGAKIALPASYADQPNGTIDLLTWDAGGVPPAAQLEGLIDTTGMNWTYAEIQAVAIGGGGKLQLLIADARPSVLLRHRKYGANRSAFADDSFKDYKLPEYSTFTGSFADLSILDKNAFGTDEAHLKQSQNRVSGWFYVPAEKAGDWRVDQGFDDYMAVAIDNDWVIKNPTFTTGAVGNKSVSEGWHTFTIVYGDTYGGFGTFDNAPYPNDYPVAFTVNDQKYKFNHENLTIADPTATYNGTLALNVAGLVDLATMDMAATCRLQFDPKVTDLHFWLCPTFTTGAKLALPAAYADFGRGSIKLMSWEQGMPDPAELEGLLDTTGMNWTEATLEAVPVLNGGELWARIGGAAPSVVFRHFKRPCDVAPMLGLDYETMPIEAYTFTQKHCDPDVIGNGYNAFQRDYQWAEKYLKKSHDRLDGWVYVTAEQAGEWTVHQRFDDFMSFSIDGKWIIRNNTFSIGQDAATTVAAGWHSFTIIFGDTNGGFGPNYAEPDIDYFPLHILKGGADIKFNSANFRFDDPTANITGDFNVIAPGVVHFATMAPKAGCRLVLDPSRTSLWLVDAPTLVPGAQLAFAAGTPTEGRFLLLTWENGGLPQGVDTSLLFDATSTTATADFDVVPYGNGAQLWVTLNANQYVATARWTGAVDSDCTKAGNWDCTNAKGQPITGVPGPQTKVLVAGNVNLQIPTTANFQCKEFAIAASTTLSADCDWRGLGVTPVVADGGEELAYGIRALAGVEVDNGTVFGTEYKPNSRTRVVADVTVKGTTEYWFGVWDVTYNNQAFCAGNDGGGVYSGYGNQGSTDTTIVPIGRHRIELCPSELRVDNTVHRVFTPNEFQLANSLTIGAQNRGNTLRWTIYGSGTWSANGSQNAFTLHGFQIYEGGELLYDYRPARSAGNGGVGLYDVVNKKFNRPIDVIPAYAESVQTLDLAGHRLQLGGAIALKDAALTVTDTSTDAGNPGRLEIEVAEGQVFENFGQLYLTGNLKLVTTGAGSFVATRRDQRYTGGTLVAGGTAGTRVAYNGDLDQYYGKRLFWGPRDSKVEVGAGGTFDLKGNCDYCVYEFVLSGGTLANSGPKMTHSGWGGIGKLTLTEDSTMSVGVTTMFNKNFDDQIAELDLGGKTLTATVRGGAYLQFGNNGVIKNGTFVANHVDGDTLGTGFFWIATDKNVDASQATVKLDVRYEPYGSMSVGDFVYDTYSEQDLEGASTWDWGQSFTTVYGTFKPLTALFHNTVMQNWSKLDLSDWSGVFNVKSGFTPQASAQQYLTFAESAVIIVDLGGRDLESNSQVIAWDPEAPPETISTVAFRLAPTRSGSLSKRADGVYFHCGFAIIVK